MIQALVIDYFFFHLILHESFSRKHDVRDGRGICKVRVSEGKWEREGGAPKDEKQVPKTQTG
jgi:hypothetical protein